MRFLKQTVELIESEPNMTFWKQTCLADEYMMEAS